MDNQDRQAIEGLFARLGEVEQQAVPRDTDAEGFIRDRIAQQPSAPYFMAQTIVMQDYALREAQQRIEELERQQAQRPAGGSPLSSFMDSGQNGGHPARSVPAIPRSSAPTGGRLPSFQPGRGGFLAGAAQTAMSVAGGVLLGNAIAGMFGGNETNAGKATPGGEEGAAVEPAQDEGGGFLDDVFGGGDEEI